MEDIKKNLILDIMIKASSKLSRELPEGHNFILVTYDEKELNISGNGSKKDTLNALKRAIDKIKTKSCENSVRH